MTNPLTIYKSDTDQVRSQDADLWDEVRRIFDGFERAAFAKELEAVFKNLHDEELVETLEKTRWTGRPGNPIKVMWRTIIASYVLDIPTIEGLRRRLQEPFLAIQCDILSDKQIPSRFAYYRFIKKLIAHTELIEKCMAKTIEAIKDKLPGFGETIVVDSTDVPTYSKRYKKPPSDPDAGWGFKKNSDGEEYKWLGYKMHLASTLVGNHEIPLMPVVTPANANDSPLMIPLLQKNKALIKGFSPKFVLADAGYDAYENYRAVVEDFGAIPSIKLNPRKKIKTSVANMIKILPELVNFLCDNEGTPHCKAGIPMVFWGYDAKQKTLKYRCPAACGKQSCLAAESCSSSPYGHVVKLKLKDDYRRFIQIPRHTKRWRKLYNHRTSIERIFSRCKKDGDGKLVNHRIRGLDKITLNCLLSVWVMRAKVHSRI